MYFKLIYLVLKDGPLNAFGVLSPAPASGWTSNSIKSPVTAASSEKAATAPQLNEQDTLVQRAEHIPAGKRTPMCAHCNQVIRCVSACWGTLWGVQNWLDGHAQIAVMNGAKSSWQLVTSVALQAQYWSMSCLMSLSMIWTGIKGTLSHTCW